jgi:hypothetical protein
MGQNHNVTPYLNSAFTASETQSAPFTFGPITFDSPGTYRYRCTIHSQVVDPRQSQLDSVVHWCANFPEHPAHFWLSRRASLPT